MHTSEIRVMKFDKAMKTTDKPYWMDAINKEDNKFVENQVWEVPEDAKIISSTWAMKKKSNGTCRARLNAQGFEQESMTKMYQHLLPMT